MDKPPILFLTNCELGQASVCLAVADEFLTRQYPVHIGSFGSLQNAVSTLNHHSSVTSSSTASEVTFHLIKGRAMRESVQLNRELNIFNIHEVGFWGALKAYKAVLPTMVIPWSGPEYMEGYTSCVEIIDKVQPGMIVVDPLLSQAKDACHMLGRQFVILSPNTFKEHVPQPLLANLWKYPQ